MTDVLDPSLWRSTLRELLPAAVDDLRVTLYTRLRTFQYLWKSRANGVAAYSVYNHTYHPRHNGDPVAEHWALLSGVTFWNVGIDGRGRRRGHQRVLLTMAGLQHRPCNAADRTQPCRHGHHARDPYRPAHGCGRRETVRRSPQGRSPGLTSSGGAS